MKHFFLRNIIFEIFSTSKNNIIFFEPAIQLWLVPNVFRFLSLSLSLSLWSDWGCNRFVVRKISSIYNRSFSSISYFSIHNPNAIVVLPLRIFPLFILVLRLTILGFASAVIEVEERTLEFLTEIQKRCCDSIAGWSSRKRTTHCHSRLQAMATRAASRIAVRAAAAARASVASYFPAQLSEATESLNRWTPGNHQVRHLNVHEYQVSLLLSFPCCWDCRSF